MAGVISDGEQVRGRAAKAGGNRRKVWRPIADAAAALTVFAFATSMLGCGPSLANPTLSPGVVFAPGHQSTLAVHAIDNGSEPASLVEIATTSSPNASNAVFRRTSSQAAWFLVALAFSLLAAVNLTFYRHLRRIYAQPRRTEGAGKN